MHDKFLEYRIISYAAVVIGTAASIFFIVKINEPELVHLCSEKQEELKQIIEDQKFLDKKLVSNLSEISTGDDEVVTATKARDSKLDWFKMPKFYLFGICYMCVRLYTNIFGTLLPFYLIDVLHMGTDDKEKVSFNLALVPMITYGASVIVSTQLNKFYHSFGRKKALFVGTAICIGCLVVMTLLKEADSWAMYIVALFIGNSSLI
jgi:Na+/melibiose symporter-like transporter